MVALELLEKRVEEFLSSSSSSSSSSSCKLDISDIPWTCSVEEYYSHQDNVPTKDSKYVPTNTNSNVDNNAGRPALPLMHEYQQSPAFKDITDGFGPLLMISPRRFSLTEPGTEYVVQGAICLFSRHILLQVTT